MKARQARDWYKFGNAANDPSVAEIHIIDFIGDWVDELINEYYGMSATVTAKAFVEQLSKLPEAVKTINIYLNTPGGDVFAAANIANALRDQQATKGRVVNVFVMGLAASAGSVIAMAGAKVSMADNALMMIHEPSCGAYGMSKDMRKTADILDAITKTIVATYQWHSSLDAEALTSLMEAETWMTADEAVANGLATDKIAGLKAAASIDARAITALKVPAQFVDRVKAFLKTPEEPAPAPKAASATEVLAECEAGNCLPMAKDLITAGATLEQVKAKVGEAKAARAAAETRANAITALCATAKQPELASGYIRGGMTVDDVKAHLTVITAKQDKVEIDANLSPDDGRQSKVVDVFGSYAALNART